MPKKPIDYAKTIIYKLVHKDDLYDENIYTGHTTDMRHRKHGHKACCTNPNKKEYNQKKYQYIRENGGWDEWRMIEIEKYPCKDKPEAIAREREIQTEMKAKLNSNIAGRTNREYMKDNQEKFKEYFKTRYKNNRDMFLEQMKQHYQNNRDKKSEYDKQYYQYNRDKKSEQHKQYYQDNRERLLEKEKQKTTCEHCGSILRKHGLLRHQRSQKCINFKPS